MQPTEFSLIMKPRELERDRFLKFLQWESSTLDGFFSITHTFPKLTEQESLVQHKNPPPLLQVDVLMWL